MVLWLLVLRFSGAVVCGVVISCAVIRATVISGAVTCGVVISGAVIFWGCHDL